MTDRIDTNYRGDRNEFCVDSLRSTFKSCLSTIDTLQTINDQQRTYKRNSSISQRDINAHEDTSMSHVHRVTAENTTAQEQHDIDLVVTNPISPKEGGNFYVTMEEDVSKQNDLLRQELVETNEATKELMAGLVSEYEELKTKCNRLEEVNKRLEEDLDAEREEKGKLMLTITGMERVEEDELEGAGDMIQSLERALDNARMENKRKEIVIMDLEQNIVELNGALDEAKEGIFTMRITKDEAKLQWENASKMLEELRSENATLSGHHNSHQRIKYVEQLKKEATYLRARVQKLEIQMRKQRSTAMHNLGKLPFSGSPNVGSPLMLSQDIDRNKMFRRLLTQNQSLMKEVADLRRVIGDGDKENRRCIC